MDMMRTTRSLFLAGGLLAAAALGPSAGLASASPAVPRTPAAAIVHTDLTGVYCTSRSSCWAVGTKKALLRTANLMLYWTGKTWGELEVPEPGGTGAQSTNQLAAVRCATARDCWAVGDYRSRGALLNQMLHWNGHGWFATRTPQPGGTASEAVNILADVTCITARNCWAAGEFKQPGHALSDEILHWNGTAWSRLRVPSPGGSTASSASSLTSVRCPSATRCLAVGSDATAFGKTVNQALTWAGRSWVRQQIPTPSSKLTVHNDQLLSLGCGSRTSCFAVGSSGYAGGRSLDQAVHWNGRSWSRSFTPQPAGTGPADVSLLNFVTCTSARSCWAVGTYGQAMGDQRNQALHWNGQHWVLVPTPDPAHAATDRNTLNGARCTSASDCWAVGSQQHGNLEKYEILHWNGKSWSVWT